MDSKMQIHKKADLFRKKLNKWHWKEALYNRQIYIVLLKGNHLLKWICEQMWIC